ncbi:MAG: preprotein translocase subunit SecE [Planctomycetota bacterium]|jgi:preprotein translocase subunit SecE
MEIYKRGQGVWARGLAIVLFLLFAGWGVLEVYRLPAELNVIVRPDDIIWKEDAARLLEAGITRTRVRGLANQHLSEQLLKPGHRPARRVEDKSGHGIILETEEFDREKLKACEEAGIIRLPVLLNEQPLDAVDVDEWIIQKRSAQEIQYDEEILLTGTEAGKPLDEAIVVQIKEILQGAPEGTLSGPFYKTQEDWEARQNPQRVKTEEIKVGFIAGATPMKTMAKKVAVSDEGIITREIYEILKSLAEKGSLPGGKIRIQDEGMLTLDAAVLAEIDGRYLIARSSETQDTWWSRKLFTIPLLNFDTTTGVLIALGLFVVVALGLLYTWNIKKWNDLLIETQTEMKKVSWPKRDELIGSSVVVIVCVVVLGLYLYVIDILLTLLAEESGLLS